MSCGQMVRSKLDSQSDLFFSLLVFFFFFFFQNNHIVFQPHFKEFCSQQSMMMSSELFSFACLEDDMLFMAFEIPEYQSCHCVFTCLRLCAENTVPGSREYIQERDDLWVSSVHRVLGDRERPALFCTCSSLSSHRWFLLQATHRTCS